MSPAAGRASRTLSPTAPTASGARRTTTLACKSSTERRLQILEIDRFCGPAGHAPVSPDGAKHVSYRYPMTVREHARREARSKSFVRCQKCRISGRNFAPFGSHRAADAPRARVTHAPRCPRPGASRLVAASLDNLQEQRYALLSTNDKSARDGNERSRRAKEKMDGAEV